MKKLHLICNAHLDPVWLWNWEEGAGEVLSTFRVAADFCEQYDGFVFNHNESMLYEWVSEYDPNLYARIKGLVAVGKWHIMGGWYLQPDCNMPSGESFIRQILRGRSFFNDEFFSQPEVAINFDPFGHSKGLVQILQKTGYKLYMFCRPVEPGLKLPQDDFIWKGYGGSFIRCHRASEHYNSQPGKAVDKIKTYIAAHEDADIGIVLWGIGDHGGGPSKVDLDRIEEEATVSPCTILHSTPEAFLHDSSDADLPEYDGDLNPWAVGCYTSQARIKQHFRELENTYYSTEKMVSALALQGLLQYPESELQSAMEDLLFCMFHDILAGTSIQSAEEASLRRMSHGLEILSRIRTKAFFCAASAEPMAREGEIPIFLYNPHPFPVTGIFSCEFQRAEQNWDKTYFMPVLKQHGEGIACQVEQEESNINLDWRKRVVFKATLKPSQLNRFDCSFTVLPSKQEKGFGGENFSFSNRNMHIEIDAETGCINRYEVDGITLLKAGAARPVVIPDNDDPWHMDSPFYPRSGVPFRLMSEEEARVFCGTAGIRQAPVRIIEDGEVRTVVESLLCYGSSSLCMRYIIPKAGTGVEVSLRLYWNEKASLLKFEFPVALDEPLFSGDDVFGVKRFDTTGIESVCHHWVCADSRGGAFSCANEGVYGVDIVGNVMRFSLLRSPAYSAHPIDGRPLLREGIFLPRIDQGERVFRFILNGGASKDAMRKVRGDAVLLNEKPFGFSFFPSGTKSGTVYPGIVLDTDSVDCSCFKSAGEDFIVRLFEPEGRYQEVGLAIPFLWLHAPVQLKPHEIKTFRISTAQPNILESTMLEEGISSAESPDQ